MEDLLVEALSKVVTTVSDPDVISSFTTDWTGRFTGHADVLVRPKSALEVCAVVKLCTEHSAKIQIQAGNTGLVGGSVPPKQTGSQLCLISTTSLTQVLEFDELTGHITVGSGMTLSELQKVVRAKGWDFAVDLAARESATVGGLVATNAGGIRVCAFGMTKRSVAGIELVLADGQIMSNLNNPYKDNTGYAVEDLAIGAEGTLGIITAVRLKLQPPVYESTVFVIPVDSIEKGLQYLEMVQTSGKQLLAAEYIDAKTLEIILNQTNLRPLWSHKASLTLLIEVAGENLDLDFPAETLGSSDAAEKRNYWMYREAASDAWTGFGKVHKLDVSVAIADLINFESELCRLLAARNDVTEFGSFGHLADGNLHIEFVGPAIDNFEVDLKVLELVAKYRGSISAEHGIGRAKREYLNLTRAQIDIDYMQKIKNAFDPSGIFNPGVLFVD
jgi:FAD/FMN-containing dehydrogenase